jgi:DNA repair protein RecO (recombination protein O)
MPGLYKDEGIVLKTIKLGEADRIVTIFTRSLGKVRAVAKGVRKTKSRFGGRLEPFTRVNLMAYQGRSGLDTITSVDVIESFSELRKNLDGLTTAAVLAEVVEKITPDREKALPTYALLVEGMRALDDRKSAIVPAFLIKLLAVSGFSPELDLCAGCGEQSFLGGFSPSFGGAICETCWPQDQDAIGISPDRLGAMSRILSADFGSPLDQETADELTHLLRRYAEFHLERPLRSLGMLRAV